MSYTSSRTDNFALSDYQIEYLRFKFMNYCRVCNCVKPPRTHHCRKCGRCVLRMDHHCPWVGNCVGLLNHKLFWLFLFYALVALLTMGILLVNSEEGRKVYNGTMMAAFAVSASLSLLLIIHTIIILNNWSTVEFVPLMENNIFKRQTFLESWRLIFG